MTLLSLLHWSRTPDRGRTCPEKSLFASPDLRPLHTSITPPKRIPAHSDQALGSKKPFFVQAATPSSPAPLGREPVLPRCPSALPAALSAASGGAGLPRLSAALGREPAELVTYAKPEGWSQRYGSVLDSFRSDVFQLALLSNHGERRNVTQVSPRSRYPRAWGGMGGEWQGWTPGGGVADGDPGPQRADRGGRWGSALPTSTPGLRLVQRAGRQLSGRVCPSARPSSRVPAGAQGAAHPLGAPPAPPARRLPASSCGGSGGG